MAKVLTCTLFASLISVHMLLKCVFVVLNEHVLG